MSHRNSTTVDIPLPDARAAAERDALLEVLAIFSHDLSNPLQSITVLCELAVDEPGAREEDQVRAQQCLDAAERMRDLVHNLAALTRGITQTQTVGSACDRVISLLSRRFERHRIEIDAELGAVAKVVAPLPFELAFLTLCLGVIATSADCSLSHAILKVVSPARNQLAFEMTDADGAPAELLQGYVQRVCSILESTGVAVSSSGARMRFELESNP